MDCKTCKENREVVSRHVHEADLDRMERVNKRWFIAWLITFLLLVGCVAGFIYYESQWEVVTTTEVNQEAIADGNSDVRLVGGDYYGSPSETDSPND